MSQRYPFNFSPLSSFRKHFLELKVFSDKQSFALSQLREPREQRQSLSLGAAVVNQ